MKKNFIWAVFILFIVSCSKENHLQNIIKINMKGIEGTVVFLDSSSNKEIIYNTRLANTRTTPCSTFKIWNTLIGIENDLINSENDPFYKWDGTVRPYADWNKDLNLQEAFQFSCVPAFQNLARKTGSKNMKIWMNKIHYGDEDISSGIDDFWLPRPGKKSIKISPKEQASLIKKLLNDQLDFSDKSRQILKRIMLYKTTEHGSLFGKTGSGQNTDEFPGRNVGWYVGYVVSKNERYSFACCINGKTSSGKDAKDIVEKILSESNLL